ncbi:MAG: hypothetical protein ABFS86_20165 [Planctomycetota bacterium]
METETDRAEILEWTCHPVRHRPGTGVLVAALILLFTAGAQLSFGDRILTILSLVVLTLSVSPFYLPTRYRIADDKISIRSTFGRKEKSLKLFRRLAVDRRGVLLSPFDRPSRLDRFHGLNLRFDSADRERVLEFLERRLGADEREDRT